MNKFNYLSLFVLLVSAQYVQTMETDVERQGREALSKFVNFTRDQGLRYMFSNKTMSVAWMQHALSLRMNGMPLTMQNKNAVQNDLLQAVEGLFNFLVVNPSLSADNLNKLKRAAFGVARYQISDFMNKQTIGAVPVQRARPYANQPISATSSQTTSTVKPTRPASGQMASIRPTSGQPIIANQIYNTKTQQFQVNGLKQLIAQIKSQNPQFNDEQVREAAHEQATAMLQSLGVQLSNADDFRLVNELYKLYSPFNMPRPIQAQVVENSPSFLPFPLSSRLTGKLMEDNIRRLISMVKSENPQFNDEQIAQAAYDKGARALAVEKKMGTLDKDTANQLMFTIKYMLRPNPLDTTPTLTQNKPTASYLPFPLYSIRAGGITQDAVKRLISIIKSENPQFNDEQLVQAAYNKGARALAVEKKMGTLDKETADRLMFAIKFLVKTPDITFEAGGRPDLI